MSKLNDSLICAYDKGYRIINGIVHYKDRVVKTRVNTCGYHYFTIRNTSGERSVVMVHRLVAYQKYGNKIFNDDIQVRHKDGDARNNLSVNVLIGTPSDNMMDKSQDARIRASITASKAIKKHDHEKIIELHKSGYTYKEIMEKLKIKSKGTISFIINKSMESNKSDVT